jgi:hypothetical protein
MDIEAHGIEGLFDAQQAHPIYRLTTDDVSECGSESTGTTDRGSNQPDATPILPNVNNPIEPGSTATAAKKTDKVRITTLNITAGYGEAAENLHAVAKDGNAMRLDVILVTETRIGSERHARHSGGYSIAASETAKNRGGVAFFFRERHADERELDWGVEDVEVYDTSVIACTLVTGNMRRRLIGVY